MFLKSFTTCHMFNCTIYFFPPPKSCWSWHELCIVSLNSYWLVISNVFTTIICTFHFQSINVSTLVTQLKSKHSWVFRWQFAAKQKEAYSKLLRWPANSVLWVTRKVIELTKLAFNSKNKSLSFLNKNQDYLILLDKQWYYWNLLFHVCREF